MEVWRRGESGFANEASLPGGTTVRLRCLASGDLGLGKIVILLDAADPGLASLRVVEDIDHAYIHLAPASLFLDDDAVTESIPVPEASRRLRVPVFEAGDRIAFHGRQGTILRLTENDYHVTIRLDEHPAREIYTNLIHLDFTPSLSHIGAHP